MNTSRRERNFPDLDQVRELPVQLDFVIPPEWEDRNGHVNVQFYLTLFEMGGWRILEDGGFDEAWLYLIVNETRGRLAGMLEYISNGVDMRQRRTATIPLELSEALDRLCAEHQALSWPPPLCGIMAP
jgi:acyl-CoA thioester hydrolase